MTTLNHFQPIRVLQGLNMKKESLAVPAPPQDLELRLVHIGHIRFDLGETSLAGDTPRGTFLYLPIIGGILCQVSRVLSPSN